MAANNRPSMHAAASTDRDAATGTVEQKKDLWNTMLGSVASGKRLPEKNLLVLGGSPQSQREVLDALAGDQARGLDGRAPMANSFALGYTYYGVLDADHEDILARISLYLLSTPSPAFAPLLTPLLTAATIPNTLIVVLLDWSEPHMWLRRLRDWILLLRTVFRGLGPGAADVMEEVMAQWRHRGREGSAVGLDGTLGVGRTGGGAAAGAGDGGGSGGISGATGTGPETTTPTLDLAGDEELRLGPGEWEDALGLPLCVVCQNAQKMDTLEKNNSWKEADFDLILQYLRTVLLRHGASLIYTTPHVPSPLPTLIHSSLGITSSLLKRQALKHNVIDRDKILVPPNWDSWGKIRVLRDGFEVEVVSAAWSEDIHRGLVATGEFSPRPASRLEGEDQETPDPDSQAGAGARTTTTAGAGRAEDGEEEESAVRVYEDKVPDPSAGTLQLPGHDADPSELEVDSANIQEFLEGQSRILSALRLKADSERQAKRDAETDVTAARNAGTDSGVSQHIGPVQFNMGGIQVDADDMIQRLKERRPHTPEPTPAAGEAEKAKDTKPPTETEQAEWFFRSLMNNSKKAGS